MGYTHCAMLLPDAGAITHRRIPWKVTAKVVVEIGGQGVIACQGGNMAGWSLYLDEASRPSYVYNWFGHEFTMLVGEPLVSGEHQICVEYAHDGGFAAGGELKLMVDGGLVAEGRVERTVPVIFSMSGETFDVGRDTGSPVGKYPHDFTFTGVIYGVTLERLAEPSKEVKQQERKGAFTAGLSAQ